MTNHKYILHFLLTIISFVFWNDARGSTKERKFDPITGNRLIKISNHCYYGGYAGSLSEYNRIKRGYYQSSSYLESMRNIYLAQRRIYQRKLEAKKAERALRREEFKKEQAAKELEKKLMIECEEYQKSVEEDLKFQVFTGKNGKELEAKVCGIRVSDKTVFLKDRKNTRHYVSLSNFNEGDLSYLKYWWKNNY